MPSGEVCNRYSLAQARFLPPHWRVTRLTVDIAPRSIEIHCGMRGFVAPCQRVPASPSTAAPATVAGPVSLDPVAGLPCDIGGGAPVGAGAAEAGVAERLAVRVAARLATPTATDLRIILCTRCATVASPVVGPLHRRGCGETDLCLLPRDGILPPSMEVAGRVPVGGGGSRLRATAAILVTGVPAPGPRSPRSGRCGAADVAVIVPS